MRTICIDFDGTLAEEGQHWEGPHTVGPPKPGALAFVRRLCASGYRCVIFTVRANSMEGHAAVMGWLHANKFPILEITSQKPPALLYVDDRAFRFTGNFDEVLQFLAGNPA